MLTIARHGDALLFRRPFSRRSQARRRPRLRDSAPSTQSFGAPAVGLHTTRLLSHEQVVGSSFVMRFEMAPDGKPVLLREAKIDFIDDGPGKPVGIQRFIGRRPIFAFGNSDGDQEMLEWTAGGTGARFMGLVHHTDAEREWAYDRHSHVGRLDKALDEANAKGWTVVDMRRDWRQVFPHAPATGGRALQ